MFQAEEYLPDSLMAKVTEARMDDPEMALRLAQARRRRAKVAPAGKLNILAADHPARRVTKVGDNPLGMADRRDYLARILRILSADTVDGLMATMDLIEEILVIAALTRPGLLDEKLLIGSLNRGGLAGTAWELDDPITGPGPRTCADWNLDGAKILLRIGDQEPDSLKTMMMSAQAMTECNALKLPLFLEPLAVKKTDSGWTVVKEREALAKLAGVASALGDSSRYMWLKLPYCAGFETVARATTLPILLLGGESAGNPEPFLAELQGAMRAGHNVRGALVGRNVLYPGAEDPLKMATAVGGIIHHGWDARQAMASLSA
jgi:hypothetical protein